LFVAFPGNNDRSRAGSRSNQNDAKKAEPSKRVYDMYGKRLRADERYIAERTLKNGRIIAYRKNKREIASLVKALKEDGFTDEKLLDPQTWLMNMCEKTANDHPPCQGGCGWAHTCTGTRDAVDRLSHFEVRYCYCVPTSH
jgi:hypothetical protein